MARNKNEDSRTRTKIAKEKMKRIFKALGYVLAVHVLALLVMTLYRLTKDIALQGMIEQKSAS